MKYTIENEALKVVIDTHGAEVHSLVSKKDGRECIWEGDPEVWGRHAPILFPYTGKLTDGVFQAHGNTYTGGQHGFARDMEHKCLVSTPEKLVLELRPNAETYQKFPFDFALRSTFTLDGNILNHQIQVENPGKEALSFGLGFHPAFRVPFDENHDTEDYEFRFDEVESPLVVDALPKGLLSGKNYYLGYNTNKIQLTDRLFDHDSFCMVNLKSRHLGIYEKDSDRGVICDIENFPYTLIWSKDTPKVRFVCIEPWHSLTGPEKGPTEWEKRPAAAILQPGQKFETALRTEFR